MDPQGPLGVPRDLPATFQRSSGDPQGTSTEAPGIFREHHDFSGNVAVVPVAATFRGPGPPGLSRDPAGSPGSSKGPSRDVPGTSRDTLGIPRERPGTHRDLQGPSRDPKGRTRGSPGTPQGCYRTCSLLEPQRCFTTRDAPQGPSGDFPGTLKDP